MRSRVAAGLLLIGSSTLGLPTAVEATTVASATGDFIANEWFTLDLAGLAGQGSSSTETSGGNHGAYRRIELTVDPLESAFQASLWANTAFTPAVSGAITSAVMSFDFTRVASSLASANQVVGGIALRQAGNLQVAAAGVTAAGAPAWTSTGPVDLVRLFPTIDWHAGGEIVFGIYNIVTALSESFTIAGGYDNFSLTIEYAPRAVPLPGSLSLLLGAFGAAALRRRPAATRG